MAETNVKAGVIFHVATVAPNTYTIDGLNDGSIQFSAQNLDSDLVKINIEFTISKTYLTKEDIILNRPTLDDLGHFPFKDSSGVININTLEVELSQDNPGDPLSLTFTAELPDSKVGGAKVGGAAVKVGGAGL